MKKLIRLCLALLVLAMLAACGGKPAESNTSRASAASQTGETGLSDSPAMEEGGYENTVTVSNIRELVAAVDHDTRIILKAGEYNFSDFQGLETGNPKIPISESYGGVSAYEIRGVSNLCLEAEEGAQVSIVTENFTAPALSLRYCSDVTLKGLTAGHKGGQGECYGSVIFTERSYGLTIEDCHLYGCGTCGLQAYESESITMTDTEIYECSENIVDLYLSGDVLIQNCEFRDNDCWYNMFDFYSSYNVVVEDTVIHDNGPDNGDFETVVVNEDCWDIIFRSCTFRDNVREPDPELLPDYIVTFEDCQIPRCWPAPAFRNSTTFTLMEFDEENRVYVDREVDSWAFAEALEPINKKTLLAHYTLAEKEAAGVPVLSSILVKLECSGG